jgi:hypothetical protein
MIIKKLQLKFLKQCPFKFMKRKVLTFSLVQVQEVQGEIRREAPSGMSIPST